MKKILYIFASVGLIFTGLTTASAQYYGSYDYGAYNTSYTSTSYTYPQTYYYGNYSGYNYAGGIGSYTIGCTTYYYNTRTGSVMYTSNICNNYNYNYSYTYPSNYYTYPYTYTQPSNQYCTYGYQNGSWHNCQQYSWFGNNNYNNGYQNYLNCYYDQYGRYICY